jgi:ubiquinone/menaquinone biosynthesis C-methylase UbiE
MHRYNTMKRFSSYWTQIDETLRAAGTTGRVLEIGVGTGLTAWYLEKIGLTVMTVDHQPERGPTVAADLRSMPFADSSFDAVVAFQVLEHIPFGEFTGALRELSRISKRSVVISLPDTSAKVSLAVSLPKLGSVNKVLKVPFYARKSADRSIGHHWEIGILGHSLERVTAAIEDAGLQVLRQYNLKENPYHQFFALSK